MSYSHLMAVSLGGLCRRAIPLVFSLSLLLACGDSELRDGSKEEQTPDAGQAADVEEGPDPALYDFSSQTAEALCQKYYDCCSPEQVKEHFGIDAADAAECVADARAFSFIFGYSQVDDSIKEGRIRVDEDVVSLCLESIRDTACGEIFSGVDIQSDAVGCRRVLQPQVALGGECALDEDCKEGACLQTEDQDVQTCQHLPALNEGCPDLRCDDGLYCDTFGADGFKCAELLADDEACFDHDECDSGFCKTASDGDKTCASPEAVCGG